MAQKRSAVARIRRMVVENLFPPIVDRATWDRAQAARSVRTETKSRGGKKTGRCLHSGVLRCACCGSLF